MLRCTISLLLLLLLLLANSRLIADEVVTVDRRGTTLTRKGTISDYKDRELTLLISNREVKIQADSIQRIDAEWLTSHTKADELFDRHQYERALTLYRDVFRDDKRRWVKRQVLARVVRCQFNTGRSDEACKNFSRLTADDEHTVYFDAIPLSWQDRPSPDAIVRQVLPWLTNGNRTANQLMAASWLLNSPHREAALRTLRELGRDSWQPIAKLAVSQLWRAELSSMEPRRMQWWNQHVSELPVELRAGSYYLLGLSLAKFGEPDQAILALMRVPTQYPHERSLSNAALLRCGEMLQMAGRSDEARQCYQRLLNAGGVEQTRAQEHITKMGK